MTKLQISIIVACYNCSKTLAEAVDSCYTQGLDSFEIIMVDDGSTDKTRTIMEELSKKYHQIRLFYHKQNRGGGGARNTAVEHSNADIIFCLDSDDVLQPNTLSRMLTFMQEKRQTDERCHGVVFHGAISFKDSIKKGAKNVFDIPLDRTLSIEDFLSGHAWGTGANFMYTKYAFDRAGGYPTHHHFDTQGFGVRFLLNGFRAYVCRDTFFYQRQFTSRYSYFERSSNAGELSIGNYMILREMCHLFNQKTKNFLLSSEIFKKNNLLDTFLDLAQTAPLYRPDYKNFLNENGRGLYLKEKENDDPYVLSIDYFLKTKYDLSIASLIKCLENRTDVDNVPKNIYYEILLSLERMRNPSTTISDVNRNIQNMIPNGPLIKGQKRIGMTKRIFNKMYTIINHE